ncbi:MBL fold metallo-hydrolase [Anaeromyxobacter paludicola]|uniref:Membrane protein n=1 Tax=Anaeromyxobacter paludicola TaxID=2918171 RepID=A0ABM7XDD0_9BACT|nr:MBL fold metallo-hydrolase [Anaeromyxobacter paludicola]BDG09874.1 membrane protein [Anaeromyxobacter paludicola]
MIPAAALVLALAADPDFRQPRDAEGRFVNLDGTGAMPFSTVWRWGVVDRLLGRRRQSPARAEVPHRPVDLARVDRPPARGEPARITWLGHAGFLVQLDGVSLLVDPVLAESPRFLDRNVPAGLRVEDLPHVDAALVSHAHYDHLDLETLARLRAPVVAGLGTRPLLEAAGLATTELGWWQSARVGPEPGVVVTLVPAQHWSRRGLSDLNRRLWGGFVIQGRTQAVYHSGDTALFDGFAEIGRRFPGLDAALLPIGAYDPGWFMERQHMSPEQALRAFEALGARRFVAMHWGTFKLTDEPLDEPPRRLEAERARRGLPRERIFVPAVGETLDLR